jgi:hypothetical protein
MKDSGGKVVNLVWPDLDFINSIAQDRTALEAIFNFNRSTIIPSGRSLLHKNLNTIFTQEETEALNIFVPYIHNTEQEEIRNTLESIYSAHTKITISWFLWERFSNINLIDIDSRIKIHEIEQKPNTKKNITSQYCLTKAFLGGAETAGFDTNGLEDAIRVCISDKLAVELNIKKTKIKVPTFFENNKPAIEGISAPIKKMKKRIHRVAKTNLNVLLSGETGSGKEAAAFFIHDLNEANQKGDFEVRNCAFFDKDFLISELFGHIKGAYTGATKDRKGLLETLGEGTLFLDELPEMPLPCQAMLLRFLE